MTDQTHLLFLGVGVGSNHRATPRTHDLVIISRTLGVQALNVPAIAFLRQFNLPSVTNLSKRPNA